MILKDTSAKFPELPWLIRVPFTKPYWNIGKSIILSTKTESEQELLGLLEKKAGINNAQLIDSATSGLAEALRQIKAGKKDEIIIPSFVCRSVINAILSQKCTPVLADVDPDFNISPKSVEKLITKKTKAIIAVHQYGKTCRIDVLRKLCSYNKITLIEDSAIPLGIKHKGIPVGCWGDYSVISFNSGKTIVGGGGALYIDNKHNNKIKFQGTAKGNFLRLLVTIYWKPFLAPIYKLLYSLRILKRENNIPRFYENNKPDLKKKMPKKMNKLQLSLILHQLKNFEKLTAGLNAVAETYYSNLANLREISLPNPTGNQFTLFPVQVPDRYSLAEDLRKKGIETQWTFYPIHLQKSYAGKFKKGPLKETDILWKKELSLPIYPKMGTKKAMFVVKQIKRYYRDVK